MVMYEYKIKIMKISGRLNESAEELPKVLNYKSKQKLNEHDVFNKALKHIRSKYGVVLEMADISPAAKAYAGKNHIPHWAAAELSPVSDKKIKHVIYVLVDVNGETNPYDVMDELVDEYGPEVQTDEIEAKINKCASQMIAAGEISEESWSD